MMRINALLAVAMFVTAGCSQPAQVAPTSKPAAAACAPVQKAAAAATPTPSSTLAPASANKPGQPVAYRIQECAGESKAEGVTISLGGPAATQPERTIIVRETGQVGRDGKEDGVRILMGGPEAQAPSENEGWAGFLLEPVPPALAEHLDLMPALMVSNVVKDSPADKAGIRRYDVIVSVNKKPAANVADVIKTIRQQKPGALILLTTIQKCKPQNLTLTLGKFPGRDKMIYKYEMPRFAGPEGGPMMLRLPEGGPRQMGHMKGGHREDADDEDEDDDDGQAKEHGKAPGHNVSVAPGAGERMIVRVENGKTTVLRLREDGKDGGPRFATAEPSGPRPGMPMPGGMMKPGMPMPGRMIPGAPAPQGPFTPPMPGMPVTTMPTSGPAMSPWMMPWMNVSRTQFTGGPDGHIKVHTVRGNDELTIEFANQSEMKTRAPKLNDLYEKLMGNN